MFFSFCLEVLGSGFTENIYVVRTLLTEPTGLLATPFIIKQLV